MNDMHSLQIAVIGAASCDAGEECVAKDAGRMIAQAGAVFLCDGRGGVMEAACRGAAGVGGVTIGVLPGDAAEANPFCTITSLTDPGMARNAVLISAAEAFTQVGGAVGNGAAGNGAAGNGAVVGGSQ